MAEDLEREFRKFDKDDNGYIDEEEFAALIASLGVQMSPEKIGVAFLAIDVDGNGRIEFSEFSGWWRRRSS